MSGSLHRAPRPAWLIAALLFPGFAMAGDIAFVPAQVANRVSVIDLLFNCGHHAARYLRHTHKD